MLVLFSGQASAAETEVIPSLELRQEYTDNFFYSSKGKLDTFVTRVTPGIKADGRTELLSGSLAARLSVLHYSANSKMDDLEQVYEGNGGCRLTPRLKIYGLAAYRRESWPDREIEVSGQALNLTSRRQNYNAGGEYQISELTVGSFGYGNDQLDYSNNGYSDVTTHNATAGVEHDAGRLLPLLKLRAAARYSRSDYETTQVEIYAMTVGAGRQIDELWSVSADAGGRYTRSSFQVLTFDPLSGIGARQDDSDDVGWMLNSSLDYRGEMLQGSMAYSRDVRNTSGRFGTPVERDIVTLSLRRRLSFELSALLGGGYYRSMANRSQFGSQEVDETSLRGSLSLRYQFNHDWWADLGYDYFHLDNAASDSVASRNKVFFQLSAQTSLFE